MNLPIIRLDWANHFIYGLVAFLVAAAVWRAFGGASSMTIMVGVAASLVLAVAKELYDEMSDDGEPDLRDAMWTFFGGLIGALAAIIV